MYFPLEQNNFATADKLHAFAKYDVCWNLKTQRKIPGQSARGNISMQIFNGIKDGDAYILTAV